MANKPNLPVSGLLEIVGYGTQKLVPSYIVELSMFQKDFVCFEHLVGLYYDMRKVSDFLSVQKVS